MCESLHVAFYPLSQTEPVYIDVGPGSKLETWQKNLLGGKDYKWLTNMFRILGGLKINFISNPRANRVMTRKLKLLSVLLNIMARSIATHCSPVQIKEVESFFCENATSKDRIGELDEVSSVSIPLLKAMWNIFLLWLSEWVDSVSPKLSNHLKALQRLVILSIFSSFGRCSSQVDMKTSDEFRAYAELLSDRFNIPMFLLCDLVAADPRHCSHERIRLVQNVGNHLNMEALLQHDLSSRHSQKDEPNVFDLWKDLATSANVRATVEECLQIKDARASIIRTMLAEQTPEFVSERLFNDCLSTLKSYYAE